jgi:hypothetical protein
MAIDSKAPQTRRALLAASIGAFAALVAQALGRPDPARAGVDGDVVLGVQQSATATTRVDNASNDETVFWGNSGGSGVGVYGSSWNGHGVFGFSANSIGVGASSNVTGMQAGTYVDGTGIIGSSGTLSPPATNKVGVFGYAIQDSAARGVYGRSNAGRGVYGQATSGSGVFGYATTGYALRASGRVKFDTASGTATIALGTKSKTVTPGFDLTSTTKVIATLMGNPGGTTTVQRVAVNATANTFTMYLTANATANVNVAWLILS